VAKLIVLGSSNAVPDHRHENTHLLVAGGAHTVLVDCVGNPIVRLEQAGVDPFGITDLLLTHFHPDHVSGTPQLLLDLWLLGHHKPLTIYGLAHTLDRVETLMGLYGWSGWADFFPVTFVRLPEAEDTPVLDDLEFKLCVSPVRHFIPTLGIRFEFRPSGKSVVYTSDTEPCAPLVRLASGADILFHEASGHPPGHSSAAQAGKTAQEAQVGALYLIHYPTGRSARSDLVAEARGTFAGPVKLAEDFMSLEF
jgi:ribonuclease Z